MLLVLPLAFSASAAGDRTVVYLKDGGTGDGSSAAQAVGSLQAAFDALNLAEDCTVVVCGKYTVPKGNYDYGGSYDGSVTFTSVYDGVDYRKDGAQYAFAPYCFACVCETKFENIDMVSQSSGVVFVAQHHPFTLGEGVEIIGSSLTGGTIAKSFTIIGGYYKATGFTPEARSDKDTDIKVLSGSNIYIVAVNRNIKGIYPGTAKIYIGGTAKVATLNASSTGVDGSVIGNVQITLADNASVGNFYGSTQTMTVESLTFDWQSGTINKFFWDCPYMSPVGQVSFTNGTTLIASEKTQKRANFAEIASQFDTVKTAAESVAPVRGTLVYLKDGGTGDGSSAARAVGTLLDAYEALDLTKDCTVVICGTFTTPKENYTYPGSFDGSVTFTSVYGGVDYRTGGAQYVFRPYCYGSACETKFENINMVSGGTGSNGGVVFVAQHHPFTVGEGVSVTGGDNLTGSTIATSLTIIGGYYTKVGEPKLNDSRDVSITVLSGSKLYILAVNRGIAGTYTGTANIHIGGSAQVSTVNASAANIDGSVIGDVKLTLTDNASIGNFYGSTQTMTVGSFTLDWQSGSINKFYWDCPYMKPVGKVTYTNGTTLLASETAKQAANYAEIAAMFKTVGDSAPAVQKPTVKSDYGCARGLYTLGLAQGYDSTGTNFGLTDKMTRAQTVVQVIRFLGVEEEVKAGNYKHPFTDVPAWADKYIGYAYVNHITAGVSPTKFNPDGETTEAQFLTFMLRAVGFSDAQGDFAWDKPYELAAQIGMIDGTTPAASFLRGGAFRISWNTLYATAKNGSPVYTDLINAGVFTSSDLDKAASAALSAKEPSKPSTGASPKPVTKEGNYYVLPVETYLDKTLCGMLSQFAGVLTGYEFVYQNGVPRLNLPDEWFDFLNGPYAEANLHNKHEDKLRFNEQLGLWEVWIDDDYSIDFFNLFMMDDMYEKYGTFATKVITDSWVDYCIYDMGGGHHTFGAYKLAKLGYFAPFLGSREFGNMYSVHGEPLIENETLGMVAAGLPNAALDLTGIFASVTSDRDPIQWAQFLAAMYSLAYVETDVRTVIEGAMQVFPENSWERSVVEGCIEIHEQYPNDWHQAILECSDRFYRPKYDKENGNLSEVSLFSSFVVTALLYGDGDYMETCRILSLAGHGGESSAAVGLGIVGIMQGWQNLNISAEDKDKMNTYLWQDGKGVVYNRSDPELAQGYWMHAANLEEYFKMSDLVDAFRRNFERVLLENGGKIENGNYYIPITSLAKQDVVLIEDFESGIDAYKTEGSVSRSTNFFSGKYGAMLSGNADTQSRISRSLSGLTVGAQYRVTAYMRTTAKTTAMLYVREANATPYPYITVYDETPFVKRTLTFTATAETMEFGMVLPAETNAFKYAVIDDILIERVEEKPSAAAVQIAGAADASNRYVGKVEITVNGKEAEEVFLKLRFANPDGRILNVPVTLNGDAEYGTVPFYKTAPTVSTDNGDVTYIPVILNRDVNTVTLDTGDSGLCIHAVEVVYKAVNRY